MKRNGSFQFIGTIHFQLKSFINLGDIMYIDSPEALCPWKVTPR